MDTKDKEVERLDSEDSQQVKYKLKLHLLFISNIMSFKGSRSGIDENLLSRDNEGKYVD